MILPLTGSRTELYIYICTDEREKKKRNSSPRGAV
jgi:hypothetical protein